MSRPISYNHPRYNDVKAEATRRFDWDFNCLQQDAVESALEHKGTSIAELIMRPSFPVIALEWLGESADEDEVYKEYLEDRSPEPDEEDLADEAIAGGSAFIHRLLNDNQEERYRWEFEGELSDEDYSDEADCHCALGELLLDEWKKKRTALIERLVAGTPELLDEAGMPDEVDQDDFYEWLEEHRYYADKIQERFDESEHYPMLSTLFEAGDRMLQQKIEGMVDELYECGIGVIEGNDCFDTMLFIGGCGYDLSEAHWIPMYVAFGWIDITKYPEPDKKLTGCNHCGRTEFTYPVEVTVKVVPASVHEEAELKLEETNRRDVAPKVLRCTYCGTEHSESNFTAGGK